LTTAVFPRSAGSEDRSHHNPFERPPAVIGQQQRNGLQLALKEFGNKLGGRDAELLVQDDELKPDVAVSKVKAFVERDKVDFVIGAVFSNILAAILKPVTEGGAFMISPNAGTSSFAGKDCNPNLFASMRRIRDSRNRAALMKADFKSVRGDLKFNTNHYPIQDFYVVKAAKRPDGKYQTEIVEKVFSRISKCVTLVGSRDRILTARAGRHSPHCAGTKR
jgi:hypothetical protein